MTTWPPRPRVGRTFYKGHGLGNDYLVFEEGEAWLADPTGVAAVCDPHRGVGADGVVVLLGDRTGGGYPLRMFNPDGTEFERSGNGLRVFASYLARRGDEPPYAVDVGGSTVVVDVHGEGPAGWDVSVEIGVASLGPETIGLDPAALDADGRIAGPDGARLNVATVWVGNPHIVVVTTDVSDAHLAEVGPFLVAHPALAAGANVQLAQVVGPGRARALVWERGVGPTSASGTSACAVAAALVARGALTAGRVEVEMPGGRLDVEVGRSLDLVLRAPATPVFDGTLADTMLRG